MHHSAGVLPLSAFIYCNDLVYREFLTFEAGMDLVDYIFEAIHRGPDGRRPNLMQLTLCYLFMFGDDLRQGAQT